MNVHAGNHIRVLQSSETTFARHLDAVAARHRDQPDIAALLQLLAQWSRLHAEKLESVTRRYPGAPAMSPRVLSSVLFKGPRKGSLGLLRDLQDLALLAHAVHGNWTVVDQIAAATRDDEMKRLCDEYISENLRQLDWIDSHIKQIAPQVLTVPV